MNFEELLAKLGTQYEDVVLYSVEDRDMTNHETAIQYYLEKDEAIAYAESIWATLNQEDRDYRELSVHRGQIEYNPQFDRYRFVVLQKHYKAYEKIDVCEDFAKAYRTQRQAFHMAAGMSEEDAIKEAKKDFNAIYAVQPVVRFGMFTGYDYAPKQ